MENAGLTDADILDREEFFTEMFDELYDRGRFRPIERAVPEVDSAPDSPVTRDTIRGTPRAAESQRPRGEERDRAPVPDQDRLDAPALQRSRISSLAIIQKQTLLRVKAGMSRAWRLGSR